MSLSLALNSAISGLNVSSRQTDVASQNIANALTPGYARRDAVISERLAGSTGTGAAIVSVERAVSTLRDAQRVTAGAAANAGAFSNVSDQIAAAVGDPGDPGSIAFAAAGMLEKIAAAAETPESAATLEEAVRFADRFATSLNGLADLVSTLRNQSDADIARQIDNLNTAVAKVDTLNIRINELTVSGRDPAALQDERDRLVDEIAKIVPVKTIRRDNEEIALYAINGGQLLDGRPTEITFTPTLAFGPDRTLANGGLSGLSIDGRAIRIGEGEGLFDGGFLSAAFTLRDARLPAISADLDALAEDAILRTQGLAADPTIGAGDAGLFTDAGAVYGAADRVGIASRMSLNPAVNPADGGEATRIRDGIGALVLGEAGNASVLRGLQDAFEGIFSAPTGSSFASAKTLTGFVEEFSARALIQSSEDANSVAFENGRAAAVADVVSTETGVDTDVELSSLLTIERIYAANARVIQTVDEMLERLLAI